LGLDALIIVAAVGTVNSAALELDAGSVRASALGTLSSISVDDRDGAPTAESVCKAVGAAACVSRAGVVDLQRGFVIGKDGELSGLLLHLGGPVEAAVGGELAFNHHPLEAAGVVSCVPAGWCLLVGGTGSQHQEASFGTGTIECVPELDDVAGLVGGDGGGGDRDGEEASFGGTVKLGGSAEGADWTREIDLEVGKVDNPFTDDAVVLVDTDSSPETDEVRRGVV